MIQDEYIGSLLDSGRKPQKRIMVGIPMTGLLRSEWVISRYGQMIPCNWSQVDCIQWLDQYSPLNFLVADARNIVATDCVEKEFEWLFFIDHDTMLPPGALIRINKRMHENKIPVFSGLYFSKSVPSEPLVYRGRGNSYYDNWKIGDEVWCDGIPMGCTLIHVSILKALYEESETYMCGNKQVRKIFETPNKTFYDPELNSWFNQGGTEDLSFCTRVMKDDIFKKAGWDEYTDKEFPFMVDTNIFCRHIDFNGTQFPSQGEEQQFVK